MTVITLSGLPGSGSTTTSKLLAKKLNLDCFSPGQLFKDIALGTYKQQYYFPEFNILCQQKNIVIPEYSSKDHTKAAIDVWNSDLGKSKEFHEAIDELQIELGKRGNIVLDGKLSLHMIKNSDCRIWLHSTQDERTRRAAERDNLDPETARELVSKIEKSIREEWTRIYGFNPLDQEKLANITIETTNLQPAQVVEKILSHLNNNKL